MGSKGIIKVAYILAEASWYWVGCFLSSEHRKLDQIGISGARVSGMELGRMSGDNTRRIGECEAGTYIASHVGRKKRMDIGEKSF